MTKIDIYSGFLGAGKTTLIKKMIKEAYHGQKLVLIENEFGEIGIDGGFLQEAGIQITEMNSGCICCSLVGDFGRALKKVIAEYAPDRILIEPSGVGKLSDVIGAVRKVTSDDVQLGNFVTVADATKCKMYMKNFGEFYNNQIETANTIILSRTDGMTEEKLDQCVNMIREHNKDAVIVTTPWPELTGEQLMEAMEQRSTIAIELGLIHTVRAGEDDGVGRFDLVVVELAEVLHIHLALRRIRHSHKVAQLHVVRRDLAHGADDVRQLADARRLDQDTVRRVFGDDLFERAAEIADQRAADAAGVHLRDLDPGLLQKAAVDADLAEFILDQHQLLAVVGFLDHFLDERRLAGAEKTGININFCHAKTPSSKQFSFQ